MQKITDIEMFEALSALTGIVDMLDMSDQDPKAFEEIGIDTVKAVIADAYVTIKNYDGSNTKMIEGKTMFIGLIEVFGQVLYPELVGDLEKRA